MKILITGGAGFIGSHLAGRLLARNSGAITVLDNFKRGALGIFAAIRKDIHLIQADVRDSAAVMAAVRDADVVFHLAAQSNVLGSVRDEGYCFSTNAAGTRNVLEAAAATEIERIVFTSSREVYGDPDAIPVHESAPLKPKNPYGESKRDAENHCALFLSRKLPVSVLRLSNVYGPGDRDRVIPIFIERAMAGEPLIVNGGRQLIDFIWIESVVDALVRTGLGPYAPGPINIGSGKGTTVIDLAHRILSATGSRSTILLQEANQVEVVRFVADVTRSRQLLGMESIEDPLSCLSRMVVDRLA
ncbi:MAG: NAD-dependent epimerase/dehydratase family protein [Bryobacteraceae bacterium]